MSIAHSACEIKVVMVPASESTGTGGPHDRTKLPPAPDKDAIYSAAERPRTLSPIWENIPAALRERRQWICWYHERRGSRWSKIPLRAFHVGNREIRRAKSDDPATWVTFGYVHNIAQTKRGEPLSTQFGEEPGPGFVFQGGGGLLGIDLDKCRCPTTGMLSPGARSFVMDHPGYWEVSPSGTGLKGFFFGSLPEGMTGQKAVIGEGANALEIEIYDRTRFFCVTGHRIEDATPDVMPVPATFGDWLATHFPAKPTREAADISRPSSAKHSESVPCRDVSREERIRRARGWLRATPGAVSGDHGGNHTFYVCCRLILGFDLTFSEAFALLCEEWNPKCIPPWDTVAEGGPDSLQRKLRDADAEGGPRGWMLTERETETAVPICAVPPTVAAELAEWETEKREAIEAAAEVRDILTPMCGCKNPRLVIGKLRSTGQRGAKVYGCHRRDCEACGLQVAHDKFCESESYLMRLVGPDAGDERMKLVARIVTPEEEAAVTRDVRKADGKYLTIATRYALSVAEELAVKLRQVPDKAPCLNLTRTLVVAVLPLGVAVPDGFASVPLANASRGIAQALRTPPERTEGQKRLRAVSHSVGWGDKVEREASDFKPEGTAVLKHQEIKEVVAELGVETGFGPASHDAPLDNIGWQTETTLQSHILSLLFRGVDAPRRPTAPQVTRLAKWWLDELSRVHVIGDGLEVTRVLLRQLWSGPRPGIIREMWEAEERDRASTALATEARDLKRGLREHYRGREHEASELMRLLLA